MSVLLGKSFLGLEKFSDDSASLSNIKYTEFGSSIIDEISIRQKTNQGMSNSRDTWQNDTILIAKFLNSLEAGNIGNDQNKIIKFKIVRRLMGQEQNDDIYLGEVPYDADLNANVDLEFEDVTNPNTDLIYSVVPVSESGLDGAPQEISVKSDFTGIWIVSKDTNQVMVFDKAIGGSVGNVETSLNEDRIQIDTFSKFPQFYYGGETSYENFTLTTVVLPDEGERLDKKYKEILENFVDHKPKIVKTDTGKIMVADISNVRTSVPMNTWDGFSYMQLTLDVTECEDYETFMKGEY
jgi:hypothetical protein